MKDKQKKYLQNTFIVMLDLLLIFGFVYCCRTSCNRENSIDKEKKAITKQPVPTETTKKEDSMPNVSLDSLYTLLDSISEKKQKITYCIVASNIKKDSTYHTAYGQAAFHFKKCNLFGNNKGPIIKGYMLVSIYWAKKHGYKECEGCEEYNEDLIESAIGADRVENMDEYIRDYIETHNIYE